MENKPLDGEQKLDDYVAEKLRSGISYDELKKQLTAVGWSDEETDSAYATGLTKCGVPVPARNAEKFYNKKSTTVEIVVNFFSFILLGIFATSLGVLLYGVINYFFEDALNSYYSASASSSTTIHYAISALIISFPLYYFAMRFWFRRFQEDEGKIESRLTKWITYLVLLSAAITIVGDLIVVIFNMLQGEITARFFLKALTILMLSGGVFGFYFLERKKIQYKKDILPKVFQVFGWATAGVVLVSIILGFFASGLPKTERMRSFDSTRASDLESLSDCIGSYAAAHKALPESLTDMSKDPTYAYCANKKDPENKTAYEYRIVNNSLVRGSVIEGEFELCANFSLDSSISNKNSYRSSGWSVHQSGKTCHTNNVVLDNDGKTSVKLP